MNASEKIRERTTFFDLRNHENARSDACLDQRDSGLIKPLRIARPMRISDHELAFFPSGLFSSIQLDRMSMRIHDINETNVQPDADKKKRTVLVMDFDRKYDADVT